MIIHLRVRKNSRIIRLDDFTLVLRQVRLVFKSILLFFTFNFIFLVNCITAYRISKISHVFYTNLTVFKFLRSYCCVIQCASQKQYKQLLWSVFFALISAKRKNFRQTRLRFFLREI